MAVTLYAPSAGEEVRATHVAQFVNLNTGASGGGALVRYYDVSDSASYSVIVGNQDTTNGYALKIQYGPVATPTTLATFAKGGSRVQSASGSHYVNVANTGVSIVGTLTLNGSNIGSGIDVFNVLDYGIVAGTSNAQAAQNTLNLGTLIGALEAVPGGDIEFPPHAVNNFYAFNAVTVSHTVGAGITVNMRGHGLASIVRVYGTAGPLLNFLTSGANTYRRSTVRDLVFECGEKMSSGHFFRVMTANEFEFRNVWLRSNGTTAGALGAIEIGQPSLTGSAVPIGIRLTDTKMETATDSTSPGVVTIYQSAGIYLTRCDFSGGVGLSTGIRFLPLNTTGSAAGFGIIDTVSLSDVLVKDHKTGIRMGEQGALYNVQISKGHLDYLGAADTTITYGLRVETAAGAIVSTLQVTDPWIAHYNTTGTGYGIVLDDAAGSILLVKVNGAYVTGARTNAILAQGSPQHLVISESIVNGAAIGNEHEIYVRNGDGVVLTNNRVVGLAVSGHGVFAHTDVTNVLMSGNVSTGKISGSALGGATSSTRVFGSNI